MQDERRQDALKRLSYIEGHVAGIRKMVEEDKYCIDILRQTLSCEHCQHAIEGSVGELPGVKSVKVDIATKTVHLDYDSQKVTLAKIEEVLDDIGYTVVSTEAQIR